MEEDTRIKGLGCERGERREGVDAREFGNSVPLACMEHGSGPTERDRSHLVFPWYESSCLYHITSRTTSTSTSLVVCIATLVL